MANNNLFFRKDDLTSNKAMSAMDFKMMMGALLGHRDIKIAEFDIAIDESKQIKLKRKDITNDERSGSLVVTLKTEKHTSNKDQKCDLLLVVYTLSDYLFDHRYNDTVGDIFSVLSYMLGSNVVEPGLFLGAVDGDGSNYLGNLYGVSMPILFMPDPRHKNVKNNDTITVRIPTVSENFDPNRAHQRGATFAQFIVESNGGQIMPVDIIDIMTKKNS